jgi:NAD(P)-dependent dehydrogenase (short-subunit alcohol dehydrogenase family)
MRFSDSTPTTIRLHPHLIVALSLPGSTDLLSTPARSPTLTGMTRTDASPRITTPFGFESTAAEVIAGVDLTGKTAIITGGSSGIGVETARALASAGATVTLAVRDTRAGERTAADVRAVTGNQAIEVRRLDLADQASVAAFAAAWTGPLHLLINNAGVMALRDLQLTPDGWELQFATNHLGHFALALGLHDALAAASRARIVSLSSRGHLRSPVVFDDINFTSRPYDPWLAYGQSKTANVLFAVEASRRWADDGITANAVHPGAIPETNLSRYIDPEEFEALRSSGSFRFKTIEQGAATSVLVAAWPQLDGIGGRYFEDCNEAVVVDPEPTDTNSSVDYRPRYESGVARYAIDPDNANRLWEVSLDRLGR